MTPPGYLARISLYSARHPKLIIAIWLPLIVAAALITALFRDSLLFNWYFLTDTDSVRGETLFYEKFSDNKKTSDEIIIFSSEKFTVDQSEYEKIVEETENKLQQIAPGKVKIVHGYYRIPGFLQKTVEGKLVSKDKKKTILVVQFDLSFSELKKYANEYKKAIESTNDFSLYSLGDYSADMEWVYLLKKDQESGEQLAMPLAIIILFLLFRTPWTAGIPLVIGGINIVFAIGLTVGFSAAIFNLSTFSLNIVSSVGLATGIDYAIFIIERYREEKGKGRDLFSAIQEVGNSASKAVFFSAITVLLAFSGLFLIPTTTFVGYGISAILTMFAAILVTMTLLPAFIALLDKKIKGKELIVSSNRKGILQIVSSFTLNYPVVSILISTGILLLAFSSSVNIKIGMSGADALPESKTKEGYQILSSNFTIGLFAPVRILGKISESPQVTAEINDLVELIKNDKSISDDVKVLWSTNKDSVLIECTLEISPNEPAASEVIDRIKNNYISSKISNPGLFYVSGISAKNKEFDDTVSARTIWVYFLVLMTNFVLLLVAFRSLIVPIKAVIMNLLSIGASYGLIVLVFQEGWGASFFGFQQRPNIETWIPPFLFSVVFGLSMDYHVFLLSRIKERFDKTGDNRESVLSGINSTARIITGAAMIMVVVFFGLALGRVVGSQQVGFGLAVAVFLDATIVRAVLVPASMVLLGKANWYLPRWLEWLPKISIEGEAHEEPQAAVLSGGPLAPAAPALRAPVSSVAAAVAPAPVAPVAKAPVAAPVVATPAVAVSAPAAPIVPAPVAPVPAPAAVSVPAAVPVSSSPSARELPALLAALTSAEPAPPLPVKPVVAPVPPVDEPMPVVAPAPVPLAPVAAPVPVVDAAPVAVPVLVAEPAPAAAPARVRVEPAPVEEIEDRPGEALRALLDMDDSPSIDGSTEQGSIAATMAALEAARLAPPAPPAPIAAPAPAAMPSKTGLPAVPPGSKPPAASLSKTGLPAVGKPPAPGAPAASLSKTGLPAVSKPAPSPDAASAEAPAPKPPAPSAPAASPSKTGLPAVGKPPAPAVPPGAKPPAASLSKTGLPSVKAAEGGAPSATASKTGLPAVGKPPAPVVPPGAKPAPGSPLSKTGLPAVGKPSVSSEAAKVEAPATPSTASKTGLPAVSKPPAPSATASKTGLPAVGKPPTPGATASKTGLPAVGVKPGMPLPKPGPKPGDSGNKG